MRFRFSFWLVGLGVRIWRIMFLWRWRLWVRRLRCFCLFLLRRCLFGFFWLQGRKCLCCLWSGLRSVCQLLIARLLPVAACWLRGCRACRCCLCLGGGFLGSCL